MALEKLAAAAARRLAFHEKKPYPLSERRHFPPNRACHFFSKNLFFQSAPLHHASSPRSCPKTRKDRQSRKGSHPGSLSGSVNHEQKEEEKKTPIGLCNLNYLLLVHLALRMMHVVDIVEKEREGERKKNPVTPCKGDTEYLSFAQRETGGVEATVPTTERAHRLLTEDRILSLVGQRDIYI